MTVRVSDEEDVKAVTRDKEGHSYSDRDNAPRRQIHLCSVALSQAKWKCAVLPKAATVFVLRNLSLLAGQKTMG